jgi:hypothetical protein
VPSRLQGHSDRQDTERVAEPRDQGRSVGRYAEVTAQAARLRPEAETEVAVPLWKKPGKRNFKHNVRVEYRALRKRGRSKKQAAKQAAAIAYAIDRRARKRKK